MIANVAGLRWRSAARRRQARNDDLGKPVRADRSTLPTTHDNAAGLSTDGVLYSIAEDQA